MDFGAAIGHLATVKVGASAWSCRLGSILHRKFDETRIAPVFEAGFGTFKIGLGDLGHFTTLTLSRVDDPALVFCSILCSVHF